MIDCVAFIFLSHLWEMGEGLSVYATVMDACLYPLSVLNLLLVSVFPCLLNCHVCLCVCVCACALNVS